MEPHLVALAGDWAWRAGDECWLEHEDARYTSELRLVAVDLDRRGLGTLP